MRALLAQWAIFQSTRPSRGETVLITLEMEGAAYFNPLAPRGARRHGAGHGVRAGVYFNPLAPRGARVLACQSRCACPGDFNPLAPRGARRAQGGRRRPCVRISIHSPLAGRDDTIPADLPPMVISIHSPLAGRDKRRYPDGFSADRFQSTRPSRGETKA